MSASNDAGGITTNSHKRQFGIACTALVVTALKEYLNFAVRAHFDGKASIAVCGFRGYGARSVIPAGIRVLLYHRAHREQFFIIEYHRAIQPGDFEKQILLSYQALPAEFEIADDRAEHGAGRVV